MLLGKYRPGILDQAGKRFAGVVVAEQPQVPVKAVAIVDNWGGVMVYHLPDDREPEALGVVAALGAGEDSVGERWASSGSPAG